MAKQAIILHEGGPGSRELRLSHILDFFGVPWQWVDISRPANLEGDSSDSAIFGSVRAVAAALNQRGGASQALSRPSTYYAYADGNASSEAIRYIFGSSNLVLQEPPTGNLSVRISKERSDIAGPMAGIEVSLRLQTADAVLTGVSKGDQSIVEIISAGSAAVFVRSQAKGADIFFCASQQIIDINQPITRGFYDIKDHFCAAVPLVLFIRFMFPSVSWQPQELGACVIIDDPLLRYRYGFCDFPKLYQLMQRHGFTTNIAFIPWNWRRTSPDASDFFRKGANSFSVSIHGCDHTAGEFGAKSLEVLDSKARLAQSRMRKHQARTGVRHDSVMVFPQGAFSSVCPPVLQSNAFLAAVNTEINPVDLENARTRIRDVWDVAITSYGGFPIFTRRYAFHGLENFAFDLLLGKPCLIVAHHDFFKDGGAALVDLVEKIGSRSCFVRWRSLGDVVRRACRRRTVGVGVQEIEMYGNELVVSNSTDHGLQVTIRKRKGESDLALETLCDERPVECIVEPEHISFGEQILAHSERQFRVVCREQVHSGSLRRSLRSCVTVAARRILCEFRDDHLSTNHFLSHSVNKLRNMLKKPI